MGFIELFDGIYRAFRFSLLLRLMIELVLTDYSTKCYIHEYVFYHVVLQFGFYRPESKMISEKKKKKKKKNPVTSYMGSWPVMIPLTVSACITYLLKFIMLDLLICPGNGAHQFSVVTSDYGSPSTCDLSN